MAPGTPSSVTLPSGVRSTSSILMPAAGVSVTVVSSTTSVPPCSGEPAGKMSSLSFAEPKVCEPLGSGNRPTSVSQPSSALRRRSRPSCHSSISLVYLVLLSPIAPPIPTPPLEPPAPIETPPHAASAPAINTGNNFKMRLTFDISLLHSIEDFEDGHIGGSRILARIETLGGSHGSRFVARHDPSKIICRRVQPRLHVRFHLCRFPCVEPEPGEVGGGAGDRVEITARRGPGHRLEKTIAPCCVVGGRGCASTARTTGVRIAFAPESGGTVNRRRPRRARSYFGNAHREPHAVDHRSGRDAVRNGKGDERATQQRGAAQPLRASR